MDSDGIMTQREREVLEESFSLYDTIGDNKVDIQLLGETLRGLGLNPTEGEVQKIVKELDSAGARRISFEEFLPIYQSFSARTPRSVQPEPRAPNSGRGTGASDFMECFRVFDKEQKGTISIGELQHVMTTLGEGLSADEVNLLTRGIEDKDGQVDIEQFVKSVMEG